MEEEKQEEIIIGDTSKVGVSNSSYDLNDPDSVAKEAAIIPEELKLNHRRIFALTRTLEGIQKRMVELQNKMFHEVSEEKYVGTLRFSDSKSVIKEVAKRVEESNFFIKRKSEIYLEVDNELDDNDKKKFSSEKSREAETNRRLYEDSEIKALEERITLVVRSEIEPGKYKYTNDKSRDYEANRRVFELSEFKLLQERERKIIVLQQETRETINYLNKRWDYMKMIISLMEVKYRIL